MDFCGNKIFGDCKTQLQSGILPAGSYVFKYSIEGQPQLKWLLLLQWESGK
jgi:hypothetical protein